WANQKVIEKRLAVFDDFAPLLNDVVCYFTYVGGWKELTPPEVVKLKRRLDRIAYVNAPLFPRGFLAHYNTFMNECYATYSGWGQSARLRTLTGRRREAEDESWNPAWDDCFTEEDKASEPDAVRKAYGEFMSYLADVLGIHAQSDYLGTGRVPDDVA
ncbi:MAG: hypothetical protein N2C14_28120, partial [Planctomycetales bacterium]